MHSAPLAPRPSFPVLISFYVGKMHRMREFMYFLDPPPYYEQPGMGDRVVVAAGGTQGGSNGGEKGASFKSLR